MNRFIMEMKIIRLYINEIVKFEQFRYEKIKEFYLLFLYIFYI